VQRAAREPGHLGGRRGFGQGRHGQHRRHQRARVGCAGAAKSRAASARSTMRPSKRIATSSAKTDMRARSCEMQR
jgi:hypothetical protein